MSSIKREIRKLARGDDEVYSIVGTVEEIKDNNTCTVIPKNGDPRIFGVRLQAQLNINAGIYIKPAIKSEVIVTFLNNRTGFVSLASEIDEYRVVIEGMELNITADGIVLNKGQNGGLTITPELQKQLDRNNAILAGIMNILNGPPVTEPGDGSPSALQSALQSAITGLQRGDFSNIENTNVKH